MNLDDAAIVADERKTYGELRYRAFGRIEGKGFCLAFTRRGTALRLISFRRAHDKEMRKHGR